MKRMKNDWESYFGKRGNAVTKINKRILSSQQAKTTEIGLPHPELFP